MKELVVATHNVHKMTEFTALFTPYGITVHSLNDYPELPETPETGVSFAENASLKANAAASQLNLPVIADDSGLMVTALGGQPGVYSARYAGVAHDDAANNAKLLANLGGLPLEKRQAIFHTTLVLAWPLQAKDNLVVTGEVAGFILPVPRGTNGFGYDPLFYLPELDKTFAQMALSEKNRYSHRGRALTNLIPLWPAWWQEREADTK